MMDLQKVEMKRKRQIDDEDGVDDVLEYFEVSANSIRGFAD